MPNGRRPGWLSGRHWLVATTVHPTWQPCWARRPHRCPRRPRCCTPRHCRRSRHIVATCCGRACPETAVGVAAPTTEENAPPNQAPAMGQLRQIPSSNVSTHAHGETERPALGCCGHPLTKHGWYAGVCRCGVGTGMASATLPCATCKRTCAGKEPSSDTDCELPDANDAAPDPRCGWRSPRHTSSNKLFKHSASVPAPRVYCAHSGRTLATGGAVTRSGLALALLSPSCAVPHCPPGTAKSPSTAVTSSVNSCSQPTGKSCSIHTIGQRTVRAGRGGQQDHGIAKPVATQGLLHHDAPSHRALADSPQRTDRRTGTRRRSLERRRRARCAGPCGQPGEHNGHTDGPSSRQSNAHTHRSSSGASPSPRTTRYSVLKGGDAIVGASCACEGGRVGERE